MATSDRQQTIDRLRERFEEALRETSVARAEGRHKEAREWEARGRQAYGALVKAEKGPLADALQGCKCRVTRREADWRFDFGERLSIAAPGPWRVVTSGGIAHGDEDDGQWFGLSKPVDGEARTNELLEGQKVTGVELNGETADLYVVFDRGARLDIFNNSSGYEGWQAQVGGPDGYTVVALGGGKLSYL